MPAGRGWVVGGRTVAVAVVGFSSTLLFLSLFGLVVVRLKTFS